MTEGRPDQLATDRRALRAIAVQFFVNGALFASFIPRMPEIRDRVDISLGGVGILMSIAGAGRIMASAAVSRCITRFGTRSTMLASAAVVSLSLMIVGLATTPVVLLTGLVGMFSFDVLVDVPMNMQASWLSTRRPMPVMNRLHGLWSLGTVAGGVSSWQIAAAGISLTTHLVLAGAALLAVLAYVGSGILRTDEQPDPRSASGSFEAIGHRPRIALGLFASAGFCAVAIESASIEWAAFRFTDDYGASAARGALGYAAVTIGMTVGRFAGDWVNLQLGPRRLATSSLAATGAGLAGATLISNETTNLLGYAVAGIGIATLLPMLYDLASQHHGKPGAALGVLAAGLRTANLTAPLLVGTLAATNLHVGSALAIVTLPCVVTSSILIAWLLNESHEVRPVDSSPL